MATARSTRWSSARSTTSISRTPGTITNFTIITPVQYPGQTETEPFARVFVLLDGTDVVLPYQPVIELPVGDVKVGKRVAAAWAPPE